ncbi:hypothetical protein GTP45_23440 [Pseudoduganella sp. FT55W]|uniref:Lipoprotein n=1 Tax=Duganella rivi TaxID=2666083 RepID=A0A7X4KE08_9BURK|nr:hypothetical protein [Duganella rivi]MYM69775.1 hypothetical protein [Duganella rivi]
MKSSYLRAGFALLCAAILSACGGNGGSLQLSGGISYVGPAKAGLVLINNSNGEKLTIETGATAFYFTKLLGTDEGFDIGILTQPAGANCDIVNNKGTANYYTVGRTVVTCTATPFTLGGTIKGLKGTGLVLANGADTVGVTPPAAAGADVAFTFPSKVPNGALYGGTVLTQPAGQTCTFDPGLNPGTMPFADQKGLIVNCTNN